MTQWIDKVQLEGRRVKLVPLEASHGDVLLKAASDGKLWELWFTSVPSPNTIGIYIEKALEQKEKGFGFPFVVLDKAINEVVGSTRYYNLQPMHRRLEIGYTWYAVGSQRTGVNTEAKLLLLEYAFETLNCIAVQFKTDWHNIRSRAAIERLGAKQDGVLRNHRLNNDGSYRDTVIYSITDHEWSSVKGFLEQKLGKRHS
jgi:RimJ/RimL family protein N-acetyltransferase